jgi:hypothetical protein
MFRTKLLENIRPFFIEPIACIVTEYMHSAENMIHHWIDTLPHGRWDGVYMPRIFCFNSPKSYFPSTEDHMRDTDPVTIEFRKSSDLYRCYIKISGEHLYLKENSYAFYMSDIAKFCESDAHDNCDLRRCRCTHGAQYTYKSIEGQLDRYCRHTSHHLYYAMRQAL